MLSKIFGGQVWNTGGAIFSTGEAHAPPIKQLKVPCLTRCLWHLVVGAYGAACECDAEPCAIETTCSIQHDHKSQ